MFLYVLITSLALSYNLPLDCAANVMDGHWRWSSLLPQGLASPRYNNTVEQQRQLIQEETQPGNVARYCFHGDHGFVKSDVEVFCAISNF